eukprot:13741400-Alexandrium_andersonii.AAC.1
MCIRDRHSTPPAQPPAVVVAANPGEVLQEILRRLELEDFALSLRRQRMTIEALVHTPVQLLQTAFNMVLGDAIRLLAAVREYQAAAMVPPPAEAARRWAALQQAGLAGGGPVAASSGAAGDRPAAVKGGR